MFFENTTDSQRYRHILLCPFIGQLTEDKITHTHMQQDSATAHTAHVPMALLRDMFGGRLISRYIWPPRSPDLIPPDFYLWGAMKTAVYKDNPLKEAIAYFITNISDTELAKVFANKIKRVDACLQACGERGRSLPTLIATISAVTITYFQQVHREFSLILYNVDTKQR
jgi:hypothetical protein